MRRGTTVRSAVTAATALVLLAGTALGAVRIGTDGDDTLTGTNANDQITGKGGNDTLKGLAGNDMYAFDDGFGTDTIEDRAKYRVDGKRVSGGIDTLSFARLTGGITMYLIPEWGEQFNGGSGSGGTANLGRSAIENVMGGQSGDTIVGGASKNTLQPGGGTRDDLYDFGGVRALDAQRVALPASDDVYKGFGKHGGVVDVIDFGGSGDVLDLRPFSTAEVYFDKADLDGDENRTEESLMILTGETTAVWVLGHFEPMSAYKNWGQQGRIETLIFADVTIDAGEVAGMVAASARSGGDGKNSELAAAAERLADNVRTVASEELPGVDADWPGGSGEPVARHRTADRSDRDGAAEAQDRHGRADGDNR